VLEKQVKKADAEPKVETPVEKKVMKRRRSTRRKSFKNPSSASAGLGKKQKVDFGATPAAQFINFETKIGNSDKVTKENELEQQLEIEKNVNCSSIKSSVEKEIDNEKEKEVAPTIDQGTDKYVKRRRSTRATKSNGLSKTSSVKRKR